MCQHSFPGRCHHTFPTQGLSENWYLHLRYPLQSQKLLLIGYERCTNTRYSLPTKNKTPKSYRLASRADAHVWRMIFRLVCSLGALATANKYFTFRRFRLLVSSLQNSVGLCKYLKMNWSLYPIGHLEIDKLTWSRAGWHKFYKTCPVSNW